MEWLFGIPDQLMKSFKAREDNPGEIQWYFKFWSFIFEYPKQHGNHLQSPGKSQSVRLWESPETSIEFSIFSTGFMHLDCSIFPAECCFQALLMIFCSESQDELNLIRLAYHTWVQHLEYLHDWCRMALTWNSGISFCWSLSLRNSWNFEKVM